MSATICLAANTLYYPNGGGHFWAYLNWTLGLKANGCKIIWLEGVQADTTKEVLCKLVDSLREKLSPYGLAKSVALYWAGNQTISSDMLCDCLDIRAASEDTDLLINQIYSMPEGILRRFRKSALLDIDPGLVQVWISNGFLKVAKHDLYFTIGETVGQPDAFFPDCGLPWQYTPPCVSLDSWNFISGMESAPLTTVTHWRMNLWENGNDGTLYCNDKRSGFLPYLNLPQYSTIPLELATVVGDEIEEKNMLENFGWRVIDSYSVTSTPDQYQHYIQNSLGEFSCVKPSCIHLQNAWISDRTICYLASGKPAVVQHTGPSRFLPDAAGLLRFRNFDEAIKCVKEVELNYQEHSKLARALAEEYFDAKKVTRSLLEKCL